MPCADPLLDRHHCRPAGVLQPTLQFCMSVVSLSENVLRLMNTCLAHFFCLRIDQWFLVISTQLIGFSAGGIARRYLVAPPSMIWPTTLVTCALFNTLHSQQYAGTGYLGGVSRQRFFLCALVASYLWCEFIVLVTYLALGTMLRRRYTDFFPGYLCMHSWGSVIEG